VAYPIDPTFDALLQNLVAGQPVLVLQNLALKYFPAWHYAVAIGFDAARQVVILRSGTTERLEMPARAFMRSWVRAGEWGLVVLPPDRLPAQADAERYLQAAAGLETAGKNAAALQAYRTALTRWPGHPIALLGMGNVYYRQRNLDAAARSYRELIEAHPQDAVAHNNLAQLLLEQGNPEGALQEIQAARAALTDEKFLSALDDTEAQIRRALPPGR
jgi:tetratricopeptide (TPR) repeat protein